MGPHDLLCKWCSTFVGKDKQFCSIFCETKHSRSSRRKLAYRRPVRSSGPDGHLNEFVSPRNSKTAPSKKQFLEDVITAITMDEYKATDRGKTDGTGNDTMSKDNQTSGSGSGNLTTLRKSAIPRLDMSKLKDKGEKQVKTEKREKEYTKPEYKLKSKTHTILVHGKKDGSVDNRKNASSSAKLVQNKFPNYKPEKSKTQTDISDLDESSSKPASAKDGKTKSVPKVTKSDVSKSNLETDKAEPTKENTILQDKSRRISSNDESENVKTESNKTESNKTLSQKNKTDKTIKSEKSTLIDTLETVHPVQQTKTASELAQRVRSSGYGAPVNPRLRPVSLKPRSANMLPSKAKRESSASSSKSLSFGVNREKSRPIIASKGQSKWELVQKPIKEEQASKDLGIEKEKTNTTLESEDPSEDLSTTTSATSTTRSFKSRKKDTTKQTLHSIDELLREESTGSILDPSVLQERLSSIKKKVEVRRRGRDSRSSLGSDLDSTLDTSFDTVTGRDKMETSFGDTTTPSSTSRTSARSNITRISKQFRSTKVN